VNSWMSWTYRWHHVGRGLIPCPIRHPIFFTISASAESFGDGRIDASSAAEVAELDMDGRMSVNRQCMLYICTLGFKLICALCICLSIFATSGRSVARSIGAHLEQLEQTLRSPSSRYYDPSVRNIHHPECQVPQLGDAFERK
jgi:hypothetical protein